MSEEDSTASSESIVEDTPSENGSEPTAEEQEEAIPEVTNWLNDLHLTNMAPQPPSVITAPAGDSSGIKINPPQEFSGAKGTMERFRMQCLLAIEMSGNKLSTDRKQVLYVVSFLRGPAYEWIHPHFKDFLQNSEARQKEFTKKMFKDYASLFDEMEEVFDNGDEALEADRDIRALRQRTSAAQYRAEFQILAAKLDWNDDALASEFYRGLKDRVREEITLRNDRPSNFKDLSELAIKIDNRIFELQLEKRGSYAHNSGANRKTKRNVPEWNNNYYGLQKMQIDATKGKPGSNNKQKQRPQPKTKGTADKSSVECYGCGKKGHYKNECNARKQRHELQGSGQHRNQDKSFRATKSTGNEVVEQSQSLKATQGRGGYQDMEPEGRIEYNTLLHLPENAALRRDENQAPCIVDSHSIMSWTACHDDSCSIHYSDKQGSGFWPSSKARSICRTIGQPIQGVRYEGGHPSPEDSSTDEESEEESEREEGQVVRYSVGYPPQQEDSSEEEGEASETESVNKPREVMEFSRTFYSIDYARIVQEFPPLGSKFNQQGAYTTPDGILITRPMRVRVMEFKREYATEGQEQRERMSHLSKPKVYTEPRAPVIPENYGEEPRYERKRSMTLQDRPPTPHVQAGTSAVLQRDSRTVYGYTVTPVGLDIEPVSPHTRTVPSNAWGPPLSKSDPKYVPREKNPRRQVILGRTPQPRDAGN
jgi:hypothetical protein